MRFRVRIFVLVMDKSDSTYVGYYVEIVDANHSGIPYRFSVFHDFEEALSFYQSFVVFVKRNHLSLRVELFYISKNLKHIKLFIYYGS